MSKKSKIIIGVIIIFLLGLINSNYIYGRVSSTDHNNVEPGSSITIVVKSIAPTEDATVNLTDKGGLDLIDVQGGSFANKESGKVTKTLGGSTFTGEIGRYIFKVPNGYGKKYNVKFSVESDAGIESTTAVIKTKEEPKKEETKKSSEEVSKKEVNKSNKIAVEKAVDTTKSNKSSNNYLKNISTSLGTLSPAFNRSQTSYILSFPYDFDYKTLEKISINAVKEDTKEKIEGTGVKAVKVGTNVYNLVVTAELNLKSQKIKI